MRCCSWRNSLCWEEEDLEGSGDQGALPQRRIRLSHHDRSKHLMALAAQAQSEAEVGWSGSGALKSRARSREGMKPTWKSSTCC